MIAGLSFGVYKLREVVAEQGKVGGKLTLKLLGHFFQNIVIFCDVVHCESYIFALNWSSTECTTYQAVSVVDTDGLVL